MSELCLGTAQFGLVYGIANKDGKPSKKNIHRIIDYFLKNNLQYIDTAQSYGDCECILGNAIRSTKHLNNLKIISKLNPNHNSHSSDKILDSIRLSLKNLKSEKLYGFIGHNINALKQNSFNEAIVTAKKKGLILKSGVSVYTPDEAINSLNNPIVDILQIPMNIFDRRWIDNDVIDLCMKKNVKIFIRSIFLQGFIFMKDRDINNANMQWALNHNAVMNNIMNNYTYDSIELTFQILSQISKDVVIILGVDNLDQ